MTALIGTIITALLGPLLKMGYNLVAGKKLSERDYVKHVLADRLKRDNAGQSSIDWEEALRQSDIELDAYRKEQGLKNDDT